MVKRRLAERLDRAFEVWYETGSFAKAAKEVGVRREVVEGWAVRYGWLDRADQLNKALSDAWRRALKKYQTETSLPMVERELSLLDKAEQLLSRELERLEKEGSADVKVLAKIVDVLKKGIGVHEAVSRLNDGETKKSTTVTANLYVTPVAKSLNPVPIVPRAQLSPTSTLDRSPELCPPRETDSADTPP